ncbi:MAG TPA: zinc ribbon domain-containing protein [Thermoplasmata archaeon]|nr:zinc ribbon domain-containing protein [Thermoplasmata archaeon]
MIDETFLLFAVIAVFLSSFVYMFYQFNLRRRRRILESEVPLPPEDRAFNQIRIARAASAHLADQGYAVEAVTESLDSAERRYARRDHAGALRLAQEAQAKLRRIHADGAPAARTPALSLSAEDPGVPDESVPVPPTPAESAAPRPSKVPKGMVEARFTLNLLEQELAGAESSRPGDPRLGEARNLRDEAQRAFADRRYPEAWSTALRARRRLGAPIEGVGGPATSSGATDPEASAAPGTCPRCGRALRGGEKFCRGCGASLVAHACPRCGVAVEASDEFCHACGSPVAG